MLRRDFRAERVKIAEMLKRTLILVLVLTSLAFAKKEEEKYSTLTINVTRESNGKPIRNASVILHFVNDKGRQSRSGMQVKTDPEGKTGFPAVPYGKVRVQVIAPGYQTYGSDEVLDQPDKTIDVKLKAPQPQYSVYDQHDKASDEGSAKQPQPKDNSANPDANSSTPKPDAPPASTPK